MFRPSFLDSVVHALDCVPHRRGEKSDSRGLARYEIVYIAETEEIAAQKLEMRLEGISDEQRARATFVPWGCCVDGRERNTLEVLHHRWLSDAE